MQALASCDGGRLRCTTDVALATLRFENVLFVVAPVLWAVAARQRRDDVDECDGPLHEWLFLISILTFGFAAALFIGRRFEEGALWWFVEPRTWAGWSAFASTWALLLPCLVAATCMGVRRLVALSEQSGRPPACEERAGSNMVFITVAGLCALASLLYAVLVGTVWSAARCRRANRAIIESVEDSDLVMRWGKQKAGATMELCGGLTSEELTSLPRFTVCSAGGSCSICLSALNEGDCARKLESCGHVFHRPCIDLWLLRCPRCPLCNASAQPC